jgi:DNA-binding response OmpR family regulator
MSKILVVDDEENIRLLYRDEFQEMGYEVLTASSGEEALEMIREEPPDLVTLDIRMGEQDGIDTLRRIKELDKDIPVVISTAYDIYKSDFGAWCSDAYIVKSSDLKELKEKVRELLP